MSLNDTDNILNLYLQNGLVKIQMLPDIAPVHCEHIKRLVRGGYYDGLSFHRVIEGFMAQGGCCYGNGTGGVNMRLPDEFSNEPHVRGTVSMANAGQPNTASTQFFICFNGKNQRSLDGKYTVWGKVISGIERIDTLKRGDINQGGIVTDPDRIIKIRVAKDEE